MQQEMKLNPIEKNIVIRSRDLKLNGILGLPKDALGIVIFAHGSGSGRFSPRNNYVAHVLQNTGIGTLLMDLLTETEERDRNNVFDIELLADRLILAKDWLRNQNETSSLDFGYFGASTGAGAALVAAAQDPDRIKAVVSRGGRPDLAGDDLERVEAPTLLIVGGEDDVVIDLNRMAFQQLQGEKKLEIIPGATHLFEEPGTLEKVAVLAADWFQRFLVPTQRHEARKKEASRPRI